MGSPDPAPAFAKRARTTASGPVALLGSERRRTSAAREVRLALLEERAGALSEVLGRRQRLLRRDLLLQRDRQGRLRRRVHDALGERDRARRARKQLICEGV